MKKRSLFNHICLVFICILIFSPTESGQAFTLGNTYDSSNWQQLENMAPAFHYYLKRHVDLDQDRHGPLSMRLLETLCNSEEIKLQEAEAAAEEAICARIRFWDGVHEAIQQRDS